MTRPIAPPRTPHFSLREWESPDGVIPPEDVWPRIQRLMEALEVVRAELRAAIVITPAGGWRTERANSTPGRAKRSQHRLGTAADIVVAGVKPEYVAAVLSRLISEGRIPEGGIGRYKSFTHYDIRGTRARWKGPGVA